MSDKMQKHKNEKSIEDSVRAGNSDSRLTEDAFKCFSFIAIAISTIIGINYGSWWVGFFSFFGILVTLNIPFVRHVSIAAISIYAGYFSYNLFIDSENKEFISFISAIFTYAIGFSAIKYAGDISK